MYVEHWKHVVLGLVGNGYLYIHIDILDNFVPEFLMRPVVDYIQEERLRQSDTLSDLLINRRCLDQSIYIISMHSARDRDYGCRVIHVISAIKREECHIIRRLARFQQNDILKALECICHEVFYIESLVLDTIAYGYKACIGFSRIYLVVVYIDKGHEFVDGFEVLVGHLNNILCVERIQWVVRDESAFVSSE